MTRVALTFVLLVSLSNKIIAQAPSTDVLTPAPPNPTPATSLPQCDGKHFPMLLAQGPSTGSTSCCQKGSNFITLDRTRPPRTAKSVQRAPWLRNHFHVRTAYANSDLAEHAKCSSSLSIRGLHIYIEPTSNPQACGTQVTTGGVATFSPEQYSHQRTYPGVTARCPYTACLTTGVPAVTLTVTGVTLHATGHFETSSGGISLTGAGERTAVLAATSELVGHHLVFEVTSLTATPKGSHARVVLSGACNKQGAVGKSVHCTVPLVPNPEVTVTYECLAGLACETIEPSPPLVH